jgi:thymidylate synthase
MSTVCHTAQQGNGKLPCLRNDEIEDLKQRAREQHNAQVTHEHRVTQEFITVFGAISKMDTKLDRLLEGLRIGQVVRAPVQSVDWELDEPTNIGRTPDHSASIWAERAREAAEKIEVLQADLLSAKTAEASAAARFDERTRHSDRVHALSITKWKLIVGLIATVVTSGTVTALIAQLLKG